MSYSSWKLNSLKDELKRRGAIMRGKKAELIERLEAYDRNFNFGFVAVDNENTAPKMCLPPPETFKDVHCGIKFNIDISKTRVETYLQAFNQNITEKSAQLFQSKFVQYLKFSATDSGVFFNSSVKAAMKKILYHVDIFITTDNSIDQCQCECAAGEGTQAHCKHITAVLLTVAMFCERNVLWIEEACTTQLQTFHQPKTKFNRSPIKASELPVLGNSNNNFDPRPQHSENKGYKEYFRNLCINFGDHTMPILQLYEPANPYGIENDHNYTKIDVVANLFQSMGLQNLSSEKICEIENKTRGQQKNKLWHYERSFRITSTAFKDVCCATERRNMKALTNAIINNQTFSSKATRHGIIYEENAKKLYEDINHCQIQECGLFVVAGFPFLAASPDGLIGDDGVLEIKCPYSAKNKDISPTTVPYLEIEDGILTLKQNHSYYFQIMGQLLATQRKYCDLMIYTLSDHVIIKIIRNDQFISNMLIKLISFYDAHFYSAIKQKYYYKEYNF